MIRKRILYELCLHHHHRNTALQFVLAWSMTVTFKVWKSTLIHFCMAWVHVSSIHFPQKKAKSWSRGQEAEWKGGVWCTTIHALIYNIAYMWHDNR